MNTEELKNSGNLDEIIRKLPNRPKGIKDKDYDLVIYDLSAKEIIEEKRWDPFNTLQYFQIDRQKVLLSIQGPDISIPYGNSKKPFKICISYDIQMADRGSSKLVQFVVKNNSVIYALNERLKNAITNYVFKINDFVQEFKSHENELIRLVKEQGAFIGLLLKPTIIPNIYIETSKPISFISFEYKVHAKTKDGQVVEINHDLALTLSDPIKYALSGISDLKIWSNLKLEQFTSNAVIELSYSDVLVELNEAIIKTPMTVALRSIGYELKQLITVPGLEVEKFYFETADNSSSSKRDYETKDPRFKIAVNIILNGRLDLHDSKTKKFIKPGLDIIDSMKRYIIESCKIYLNEKTPEDCILHMYELEEKFISHIRNKLLDVFAYKELDITLKFLETDLSRRFALLQEKPYEVKFTGDFLEKSYSLWFRVFNVSEDGWYRFRANNYASTETEKELQDIGRMIKNGMANIARPETEITGKLIADEFKKIQKRVKEEFGLEIRIHDFNQDFSSDELLYIEGRKNLLDENSKRIKMIELSATEELVDLLKKQRLAKATDESETEIERLQKRIDEIKDKSKPERKMILGMKTDNKFLNSSNEKDEETTE